MYARIVGARLIARLQCAPTMRAYTTPNHLENHPVHVHFYSLIRYCEQNNSYLIQGTYFSDQLTPLPPYP